MPRCWSGMAGASSLAALILGTQIAAAQPAGRAAGEGRPLPLAGARADEVRQAMEEMVIARLKVALRLTEEQETRVVPRVRRLLETRRRHAAERRAAMARVRGLLEDRTAGDQEIDRALRDVRAVDREFLGRETSLRESIDGDLTPRQQARMIFFEARMRRLMQRRVQEALQSGRPPGAGRSLGGIPEAHPEASPPDGDDSDDLDPPGEER